MRIVEILKEIARNGLRVGRDSEELKLLLGKQLALQVAQRGFVDSFQSVEFKVFSQFGDDGIIQYLISKLDITNKTFIEFGVEDYYESNTRFLLMNNNWSGFAMDGAEENIAKLMNWPEFWKYDLRCKAAFIDRDNINSLLAESGFGPDLGLLHIDLDGNDYWIWEKIDAITPHIVILEYNSVFGIDRQISVPYDKCYQRSAAHYSTLYWGASLAALHALSQTKGYAFVGCNSNGNNAYFVRRDKLGGLPEQTLEVGFVESKIRESRDINGKLTYVSGKDRLELLKGLPVVNVATGLPELL